MAVTKEAPRETTSGTDEDNLWHRFCGCGLKEWPNRARCGKVKKDWRYRLNGALNDGAMCVVCQMMFEDGCKVCGW
jgi:hypothetical protein